MPGKGCCVVRCGGIGDDLIATSPLPLLKAKYGWVEFIAQTPYSAILENNPHIDRLIQWEPDHVPLYGEPRTEWFRHRFKEFEFGVDLSYSCEVSLAMEAVQGQYAWNDNWRRKYLGHSYLEFVHDVADVAHDFTVGPRFYPTDEEKAKAKETRKTIGGTRLIGICLSGSRIDKFWPYLPATVAKLRTEYPDTHIVLVGGPKDFPIAKAICEFVALYNGNRDGILTAISDAPDKDIWPIRRSLTLLQECDLVISPDTGTAWAVAMEPMPKVVLISHAGADSITKHWNRTTTLHADPKRVPCWSCHRLIDKLEPWCHQAKDETTGELLPAVACMADIRDEQVLDAVRCEFNASRRTHHKPLEVRTPLPRFTPHYERNAAIDVDMVG